MHSSLVTNLIVTKKQLTSRENFYLTRKNYLPKKLAAVTCLSGVKSNGASKKADTVIFAILEPRFH